MVVVVFLPLFGVFCFFILTSDTGASAIFGGNPITYRDLNRQNLSSYLSSPRVIDWGKEKQEKKLRKQTDVAATNS